MILSNKYDVQKGVGTFQKLFGHFVYKITPDFNNVFVNSNGQILAKRHKLDLTQDSVYKTQFFNPLLSKAFQPYTESTKIILYDEDDNVIDETVCRPELNTDYASIICQQEPEKPIVKISVVIYEGPVVDTILMNDGTTTMQSTYNPQKPTDVVTKKYADDLIEDFTAATFPLKKFSIKQGPDLPVKRICYSNGHIYPTLSLREHNTIKRDLDCILTVDSFSISNEFIKEETRIGLVINGVRSNPELVTDVLAQKTPNWKVLDSENIFMKQVDSFFWKHRFQLTFNLNDFAYLFDHLNPYFDINIQIWDKYQIKNSEVVRFGIDERVVKINNPNISIDFISENFIKHKTVYVSGSRYFPKDPTKQYDLPVMVSIDNNFLAYYRDITNVILNVLDVNKKLITNYPLTINSHQPVTGKLEFQQDIKFTIQAKYLQVQVYNVFNQFLWEAFRELDTETDTSDESNRVTTPAGSITFPDVDYGETWQSNKPVRPWDMISRNGVYTHTDPQESAICFVTNPKRSYSHIHINIEHDGQMYIKSEGNTDWLNCQEVTTPFKSLKENNDSCGVNTGFYTFGRVVYKSPVFIRIIHATKVIFKGAYTE